MYISDKDRALCTSVSKPIKNAINGLESMEEVCAEIGYTHMRILASEVGFVILRFVGI